MAHASIPPRSTRIGSGFSDFFASVFGGRTGRAGGGRGVRFTMPGSDVEAELPVTVEDLLRGGKRRITLAEGRSLDVDDSRRRRATAPSSGWPARAGAASTAGRRAISSCACASPRIRAIA